MRDFFLMMGVQFTQYLVLTVNFRAIAHNQIYVAMVSDALAVALSFFIVKKIVRTESRWTLAGMMIGGALAAAVGMTLTEAWG